MRKKHLILVLSAIGMILFTLSIFLYSHAKFPDFEFDHAVWMSADRNVLDTASENTFRETLMPIDNNPTDGASFLDMNGHPIHNYFTKIDLSKKDVLEIQNCLRMISGWGEKTADCLPIYRDVIVYYNRLNKPVGLIAICFECKKLQFHPDKQYISNSSIDQLELIFKNIKIK